MADTQVQTDTNVFLTTEEARSLHGPYWSDEDTAHVIHLDQGGDLNYSKTTDGGATWAQTQIVTNNTRQIACWFDRETPGNTGNLIHIVLWDAQFSRISYRNLNVTTDAVSTRVDIVTSVSPTTPISDNFIAITRAKNGNLLMAYSNTDGAATATYRSTDVGATWSSRTNIFDGSDDDAIMFFPANTADDADVAALYHDVSTNTLEVRMYDDSANTWTATTIDASVSEDTGRDYLNFDGAVRHSDGKLIVAYHNEYDSATDDLETAEVTVDSIASPTVTAKTAVASNIAESTQAAIVINQQNDDIYIAYSKGGTHETSTDIVYHKSTDDMSTWGSEQAYSEMAADDNRAIHGGRSVGSSGGFIQFAWYNDDTGNIYVNLVNDVAIAEESSSYTASLAPLVIEVTPAAVTASSSEELSAAVSPVLIEATIPAVTAQFDEVVSATVGPVVVEVTAPAVTAGIVGTAGVTPVVIEFTLPSVTGSHQSTAQVDPAIIEFSVPAVSATSDSTLSATVSPVVIEFTVPPVTATNPVAESGSTPIEVNSYEDAIYL